MTQTTHGVLWDLRPAQGPPLHRVVGTLVEPYHGEATFSGQVTVDGVPTRYHDVPPRRHPYRGRVLRDRLPGRNRSTLTPRARPAVVRS
jgi:hypothetical protein